MMRSLPPRALDRLLAFVLDRERNRRLIAGSGLFDEAWYVGRNPEAAQREGGPLRHYMRKGAPTLLDPNPYFDAAWYAANRPAARQNPLLHYLKRGAAEGLSPSPAFDPAWYRKTYPDIAAGGFEPLAHFLRHGRCDGRLPKAPDFRPVEEAELLCVKRPARGWGYGGVCDLRARRAHQTACAILSCRAGEPGRCDDSRHCGRCAARGVGGEPSWHRRRALPAREPGL